MCAKFCGHMPFRISGGGGKLSSRRKTVLNYTPFKKYVLLRTLLNKILNDFAFFGHDTNKLLSQIIARVFVELIHIYLFIYLFIFLLLKSAKI